MVMPKDPIKAELARAKMRLAKSGINNPNFGKKDTDETRLKKSESQSGNKNHNFGKKHTPETIEKMKAAHSGEKNAFYGKTHTKESIELMKKNHVSKKGVPRDPKMQELLRTLRIGKCHPNSLTALQSEEARINRLEVQQSEEYKQKQRDSHKGDKCHLWKGGVSFEPYCMKFNNGLRERVRIFFGRRCLNCNKEESENKTATGELQKLSVHHITFNKQTCCDNKQVLLAPLYLECRTLADNDRDCTGINADLTKKIIEQYNGKCYLTIEELLLITENKK
jgi:hypothetical protein